MFCKGLIKTSAAAKTLATELCKEIGLEEEDAKQHTYHRNQKSLKIRFDNDRLAYCLIPNTSERPAPITFQYGQHPTDAPQSANLALTVEEFEKVQSNLKSNKKIGQ